MRRPALILLLCCAPALARADDPPATQPHDSFEIWVQPLGSILYGATVPSAYVSLGFTVRLPQRWELVFETTFQYCGPSCNGASTTDWQLWFAIAAVHFFHVGNVGRPQDGFFVGPKLELALQQLGPQPPGTTDMDPFYDDLLGAFAVALTLNCEAGYRFQLWHFVVSLVFPSLGIGYAENPGFRGPFLSPYLGSLAAPGTRGFTMSLDLNLLRLGVSF